jgi:hypothetical protein
VTRRANHFALSEEIEGHVKPSCEKYSASVFRKCMVDSPYPASIGGAYRGRHGRWKRGAVDAWCREASGTGADERSRAVLIPRGWDQVRGVTNLRATEAKAHGTPRRPRISRKPLRRERPIVSAALSLPSVRKVHFLLHARLAGAASIRCSLRPPICRGRCFRKTRAFRAARTRSRVSSSG